VVFLPQTIRRPRPTARSSRPADARFAEPSSAQPIPPGNPSPVDPQGPDRYERSAFAVVTVFDNGAFPRALGPHASWFDGARTLTRGLVGAQFAARPHLSTPEALVELGEPCFTERDRSTRSTDGLGAARSRWECSTSRPPAEGSLPLSVSPYRQKRQCFFPSPGGIGEPGDARSC